MPRSRGGAQLTVDDEVTLDRAARPRSVQVAERERPLKDVRRDDLLRSATGGPEVNELERGAVTPAVRRSPSTGRNSACL
jgi:hypothetical protein